NMRNNKGFTLVEVLIIILLLGFLGVAAIGSYVSSTKTFSFLGQYKGIMSSIRSARSYAITNKDSEAYRNYGVKVENNKVTLFGDGPDHPFNFGVDDSVIEIVEWDASDYVLDTVGLSLPTYLYYRVGSGEFFVYSDDILVPKSGPDAKPYIVLKFTDADEEIERYITVVQVSGLAEETTTSPD
ncbi:MAG: prepilin-type N-terminal cleavage/methylation domain-containing protein, partial [Candidatus Peregrinibacteria bacterium]